MIITPRNIQAALRNRVEELFPGEPVYEDIAPEEFQRPGNLLELVKMELDAQGLGRGAVGLRYQYKITTFSVVDEARDAHLAVLDLRAMLLLGAFAPGYLKAGDRALTVAACTADTSLYDCAEVTLTLALTLDRAEFAPGETLPIMKDLTTRYLNEKRNEHE